MAVSDTREAATLEGTTNINVESAGDVRDPGNVVAEITQPRRSSRMRREPDRLEYR